MALYLWLHIVLLLYGTFITAFHERISIFTGPDGGHPGVTQSLMKGLQLLNIPFDHNNYHRPAPIVVVLADTRDLQRAITLKRQHKIKLLLAGPNLVVRANDCNGIIGSQEVDVYLVPAEWTRIAYEEDLPKLKGRIQLWFAGIDTDYWQPIPGITRDKVLIYWKTESRSFCAAVEHIVKEKGFEPLLVQYGHYSKEQFRKYLNQSSFAIFISQSESQGLALAEAWAMDVPTLAFNPGELDLHGRHYTVISSCPFLTETTGCTWKTLEELDGLLAAYTSYAPHFAPRSWVVNNMTMAASARELVHIIKKWWY